MAKNSLKVGSKCTELVSSTRKLAPGQDETSKSALVAAVELLFCLPQFGTMSSSVWDNLSTVTATAFPSWISFIFAPVGFLSYLFHFVPKAGRQSPKLRKTKSQTEEDIVPNGGRHCPKLRKTEKQLYSHNQCTFGSFVLTRC